MNYSSVSTFNFRQNSTATPKGASMIHSPNHLYLLSTPHIQFRCVVRFILVPYRSRSLSGTRISSAFPRPHRTSCYTAAIPYVYTEFHPTSPSDSFSESSAFALPSRPSSTDVQRLVRENAVIVFGKPGCCMIHVVRLLLLCLGVNPLVSEVGEDEVSTVVKELERVRKDGGTKGEVQFPAVFIGGKHFGGLDRVMATHVTGELVPLLKEAGALRL